jgi:hypothetical protein
LIYNKNSKHKDVLVYFWIEDKQLYLITKICVQKVTEFKSFGESFGFGRNWYIQRPKLGFGFG